jgi:hypothetical protein
MPIQSPIFAPAIALVLWSLLMLAWLAVTRCPRWPRPASISGRSSARAA